MAKRRSSISFVEEVAKFLASLPTRDQWLNFHPSEPAAQRAEELLQKQNDGQASREEQDELEELVHTERLMRLVKARLRGKRVSRT